MYYNINLFILNYKVQVFSQTANMEQPNSSHVTVFYTVNFQNSNTAQDTKFQKDEDSKQFINHKQYNNMDKFLIGNEKPKRNIQKVTYVDLSEDGEFQSHNEENESDTDPTEVTVLAKKPRKSKITQPREPKATANKGGNKIAGQTLEQHRRGFGDKIKQKIHVEKWFALNLHLFETLYLAQYLNFENLRCKIQ